MEASRTEVPIVTNPNRPDVAPLVTVALTAMPFTLITILLSGAPTRSMPDCRAALTLEDGSGSVAN